MITECYSMRWKKGKLRYNKIEERDMKIEKKKVLFIIAIFILPMLLEIFLFQRNIVFSDDWGRKKISYKSEEITLVENSLEDGKKYIELKFDERFVNKLQIEYQTISNAEITINTTEVNGYGKSYEGTIQDTLYNQLNVSYSNIASKVNCIRVIFSEGVEIENIYLNNEFVFNFSRYISMVIFLILMYFIIVYNKFIIEKVEWGFLVVSSLLGILFISVLPIYGYGWDNHIHFSNAYEQTQFGIVNWTESARQFASGGLPEINTYEENRIITKYLNERNKVVESREKPEFQIASINKAGYIGSVMMMKIGMKLKLPFSLIVQLGKMGNLMLYTILIFFAIKYIPFGKHALMVFSLVPTAIYQASFICYDPVVTAGMFLFFAIIMKEISEKDNLLNKKVLGIALLGIILASLAKAVYAPFILIAFLLPKSKFSSKKEKQVFYIIISILFIILLSTFVLPTLFDKVEADYRGGDTNVGQQFKLIFSHPITYAKLLLQSIYEGLIENTIGSESTMNFAYLGIMKGNLAIFTPIFLLFVTCTDDCSNDFILSKMHRLWVVLVSFVVVCFIWTALYLAFTPVGTLTINGVSPRYFISILPLALITIFTGNQYIRIDIKKESYSRLVFLGSIFISFATFYELILSKICV